MMYKKLFALQLLMLVAVRLAFSQTPLAFFETVSSSKDTNTISMTTDLFYTQLNDLTGYTVTDRRGTYFDSSTAPATGIAFYAEVQEADDGSWVCTLNAIRMETNRTVSATKTYASYYKILLDAKASLESVLNNLNSSMNVSPNAKENAATVQTVSIDNLAGTWGGETVIDKIVILRGGRGFVIFKNGASMPISITVSGASITIRQTGKANASFFPELPKEIALKNVANAEAISWTMTLLDGNTMDGIKHTLIEDKSSSTGASAGTMSVKWTKR